MWHSYRRDYRACAADLRALLREAPAAPGPSGAVDGLCAALGRRLGLTIHRHAASLGGNPYGLVLRGGGDCLVLYERQTSPWHQQGIILHELGHLLYGHRGVEAGTAAALRALVPDLPAARLDTLRGRADGAEGHDPGDERLAEAFATVGLAWLARLPTGAHAGSAMPGPAAPDDPAAARAIRRLLDDFAAGGGR